MEQHELYVEKMGEELGGYMNFLWHQITEILIVRNDFEILFLRNQETIDLINDVSSSFFWVQQKLYWSYLVVSISALTEDEKKKTKLKKLTLHSIERLVETKNKVLARKVKDQVNKISELSAILTFKRNNEIAHYNYHIKVAKKPVGDIEFINKAERTLLFQEVDVLINAICKLCSDIFLAMADIEISWQYQKVDDLCTVDHILTWLKCGQKFENISSKHMKGEKLSHEDFE